MEPAGARSRRNNKIALLGGEPQGPCGYRALLKCELRPKSGALGHHSPALRPSRPSHENASEEACIRPRPRRYALGWPYGR